MAVVRFVGMKHHDLAGPAGPECSAIVERLRAEKGETHAIGLMSVQVVGMAAEPSQQSLQPFARRVEVNFVGVGQCTNVQDEVAILPQYGGMIYDTKTALVLRADLAGWQLANVAAFLTGGLAGKTPDMMGEPYRDSAGRVYSALVREPVFVYGAALDELRRTHRRALARALCPAIYIEQMFKTTNDADNRAAVAAATADALDFVGIGLHGPRKLVDKVINGLKLLA